MENSFDDYEPIECEFTVIKADSGAWVFIAKPEKPCNYEGALDALACFINDQQSADMSMPGPTDTVN